MSDTPRTDALLLEINEGRIYKDNGPRVDLCRELERELRAELGKTEAEWRPIDTAPKDGSRILLYRDGWSAPMCGQWYGTFWSYDYDLGPFKHEPTHWQPLPKPPTA